MNYSRRTMHLGASSRLFQNAYLLRKNPTKAESILWARLRNRQVEGVKFRRQHPMHKFIADFYAHEIKLVIEVDGSIHAGKDAELTDAFKEDELDLYGIKVIRFTNDEIFNSMEKVIDTIRFTIIRLRSEKG